MREAANLLVITGDLDDPLSGYPTAGPSERTVLDSMMQVIERAKLRGHVSMFALRSQSQLAAGYRYLSSLDSVFALTALYEPFGLAPLEAMAAGMPAVVTKFGGPSESLREGDEEFGVLVDPTDPLVISAGLFSLIGNPESRRRFAEAGYNRVLAKYTWRRTAEGYLRALAGRQSGVDHNEAETRATAGTSDLEGVQGVAARAFQASRDDRPRLEIPTYFLNPSPEHQISLETLDDVYLKIDLLAVGETLVDFISYERVQSLRTAAQFTRYLGGQPANVAVYVAKLSGRSAILSKIGGDYFGEFLEDQLLHHGVSTEASPHKLAADHKRLRHPHGDRADFQVNRGADVLLDFREVNEELIERARAVHTSVFALSQEPQRSAMRRVLRLASRHGKLVSLDPNYSKRIWPDKDEAWEVMSEILPHVTVIKPSLEDARRLFDPNLSEDALEDACLREFHSLGVKVVILTRSGGTVTVSEGGKAERVGPLPMVRVENVTGGRDAFWSGLILARLDGKPWPECVRFAHEVASLKLQVVGHVERMIDRQKIYDRLEAPAAR
ncbi:MAG: PfkB family carbohydrate kinase [Chloroflexia bacterium]